MPRKPREFVAGGVYHVFARGNDKRVIFVDDADRRAYLALVAQVVARRRWLVLTYCLMDNHLHLLVETPEPDLGRGMQWVHGSYARYFNRRHRRCGHLFQGRYGDERIEDDAQLYMTTRYIVQNPVEAGLCPAPHLWPWSAHAATIGVCAAPPWLARGRLLDFLAGIGGRDGTRRYVDLVAS